MTLVLNLGCGTRTSPDPRVLGIDRSAYAILSSRRSLRMLARVLLDDERRARLNGMQGRVLVHDLRRGIPFPDHSVDAVYHSHFLEHIDREAAPALFREIHRVLKPGGIHRVVVPDLASVARAYLDDFDACVGGQADPEEHETWVAELYWRSVLRKSITSAAKGPLRSRAENLLLGDARRRGDTHQWMYDRVSLEVLFRRTGFAAPRTVDYDESAIPAWNRTGLDMNGDGTEHMVGSLYMEAATA